MKPYESFQHNDCEDWIAPGMGKLHNANRKGEENLLKAMCDNYTDPYSQTHTQINTRQEARGNIPKHSVTRLLSGNFSSFPNFHVLH